jgi:sugar phosphate isomerase/epimerase
MASYRIGAHPYIFVQYGYDLEQQFDDVFDIVANAGYQTIELHEPMLYVDGWKERIDNALGRTSMGLVGGSNGQPVWNTEQYSQILSNMDDYSTRLSAFGNVTCGMSCSGKRYEARTHQENAQAVKVWCELGEMFRDKGVTLNYHTHGEPIQDIRHMIDNVPAELVALGPDLDWLRVGGVDPVSFVEEQANRLILLHIRDYHTGGERTEALGEGDADYQGLGHTLETIDFQGELVVELALPSGTKPTRPIEDLLRISREHLKETMGC